MKEEIEDTKGVKDNTMAKRKRIEGKNRSTKHTHKTKDQVTRTPLKTVGELRCSGRVPSSYSTCGIRLVNLVTNPGVICASMVLFIVLQNIVLKHLCSCACSFCYKTNTDKMLLLYC
jgi:hypothetical protein